MVDLCSQMEGDSSTTDATQLGITGEFMTGGTYVLQAQDGKDMRSSLITCVLNE